MSSLILGVVAALALAACGGSGKSAKATPTVTGAASTAAASLAKSGGAGADLASALTNFSTVKSFRGKVSLDNGNSKADGTLEAVLPDRFHIAISGAGSPLGNFELISIGDTTYTKLGADWTKEPSSSAGVAGLSLDPKSLTDEISQLAAQAQVTKGGSDSVNGKSCQVYNLSDSSSQTKMDVCIADNLPLRLVANADRTTVTVLLSDFNANIAINAPI